MLAADPTEPTSPKRTDRQKCPGCDTTPASCAALHWIGGRYCCATCEGDHDQKAAR